MIEKAWMIRNDSLAISVTVHPYGEPNYKVITDENTFVASFLYEYGKNKDVVKEYFIIYFAYYIDGAGLDIIIFDQDKFITELINSKNYARIIYSSENQSISVNEKLKEFWGLYKNDVIDYLKMVSTKRI